jgi:hypothetical protein
MDNDDSTSDGPAFAYGGIPSDEEDLERPGQEDNSALSNRYRVRRNPRSYWGNS